MDFIGTFIIAFALSMDAFAVAICKGLASGGAKTGDCALCGLWFGTFQGIMPVIGYFFGSVFGTLISRFDHYIAFALLLFIGTEMLLGNADTPSAADSFGFTAMLSSSFATSIDALAAGVTFGILPGINIIGAACIIFSVTFILSSAGVKLGSFFGMKWKKRASILGGCILILMGIKILLEHLGILIFPIL